MSKQDFRPIVFTDLDDTICQNVRQVEYGDREGVVSISKSMLHNTCMTVKQQNMLRWLVQTTELVPVTARGIVDFSDIDIDFGASRHRVVANGAVILDRDGGHDEEWARVMAEEMAPYQEQFAKIVETIDNFCSALGHEVESLITSEHGMSISALFHAKDGSKSNASALAVIRDGVENRGWHTHLNGNTLAFTPPPVSKRRAVEHLLGRIEGARHRPVIGMGDSLSDLGFMAQCDFLSIPRGSQISSAFAN
jgi:hydroxymethylpyrimidine pyrophosphatase-like HAD family hydrolase